MKKWLWNWTFWIKLKPNVTWDSPYFWTAILYPVCSIIFPFFYEFPELKNTNYIKTNFAGSTDDQETQSSSSTPEVSRTYTGSGDAFYKQWQMNLVLQGSQNSTHFVANCKGSYKPAGSRPTAPTEMITLQMLSTNEEKRRHKQLLGTNTDTKVTIDFTQHPEYNMQFIWNSQVCTLCHSLTFRSYASVSFYPTTYKYQCTHKTTFSFEHNRFN